MASKLIMALASLATLGVICKGDKVLFHKSDTKVPSNTGDIILKLNGFDGSMTNQQVFDFVSALPPTSKVAVLQRASELVELANLSYSKCLPEQFELYAEFARRPIGPILHDYSEFCRKELVKFCLNNTDKVIEAYFSSNEEGKKVVARVSEYIDEFEKVARDDSEVSAPEDHCKEILRLVDDRLAHLKIKPQQIAAYLSSVSGSSVEDYVEKCRAYIGK